MQVQLDEKDYQLIAAKEFISELPVVKGKE